MHGELLIISTDHAVTNNKEPQANLLSLMFQYEWGKKMESLLFFSALPFFFFKNRFYDFLCLLLSITEWYRVVQNCLNPYPLHTKEKKAFIRGIRHHLLKTAPDIVELNA